MNDLDIIWVLPKSLMIEKFQKSYLSKESINPNEDIEIKDIIKTLAQRIREQYLEQGIDVDVKEQSHRT